MPGMKTSDFNTKSRTISFLFNINVNVNSAFVSVDMIELGMWGVKDYI